MGVPPPPGVANLISGGLNLVTLARFRQSTKEKTRIISSEDLVNSHKSKNLDIIFTGQVFLLELVMVTHSPSRYWSVFDDSIKTSK